MTQTNDKLSTHVSVKEAEMAEVLAKIVRDKYQWVEARKQQQPLNEFKDALTASDRSFYVWNSLGKVDLPKANLRFSSKEEANFGFIPSIILTHGEHIELFRFRRF